jgi:hypothetical protein
MRFHKFILVASILNLASACNKRITDTADEPKQTSLAGKPRALMLVFGDRSDPRAVPIATLADGKITPIMLDTEGWRGFDRLYFPTGTTLHAYRRGQSVGEATIRRGMWDGDEPLYALPGCHALRPLAALKLPPSKESSVMLEMLATSDPLAEPPPRRNALPAEMDSARVFLARAAQREGLTKAAREELDLVVDAVSTSATPYPSLVGWYLERGSGLTGKPRHVFAIGDYSDSTHSYLTSFVHVPDDSLREFRRFVDHADLTGDGVDEIVLEGWRSAGESFLVFLQFSGGHWREVARGATSWCADDHSN